jgi:hypothetical protein
MTPKEFADDTIEDLILNYGLDKGRAIEIAMYVTNRAHDCNGVVSDYFLMEVMEELDDLRLTHK